MLRKRSKRYFLRGLLFDGENHQQMIDRDKSICRSGSRDKDNSDLGRLLRKSPAVHNRHWLCIETVPGYQNWVMSPISFFLLSKTLFNRLQPRGLDFLQVSDQQCPHLLNLSGAF